MRTKPHKSQQLRKKRDQDVVEGCESNENTKRKRDDSETKSEGEKKLESESTAPKRKKLSDSTTQRTQTRLTFSGGDNKSFSLEKNTSKDNLQLDIERYNPEIDYAKRNNLSPAEKAVRRRSFNVGAHFSGAGGVQNALDRASEVQATALALFLKSQRKWTGTVLTDTIIEEFVKGCDKWGIDASKQIVPHGSYLVNLAHPDKARADQAYGSFIDDLERCHRLGIKLYNFHPGFVIVERKSGKVTQDERQAAITRLSEQLNKAHTNKATGNVITLLETMSGSLRDTEIGSHFEDLRDVIEKVVDKSRIGVCFDTCHVFASGYDLRAPGAWAKTMAEFDAIVGLKYLRAIHVNDSKAPFGSLRDVHANIGTGYLGLQAFWNLMNDDRLKEVPMILETPIHVDAKESKKKGAVELQDQVKKFDDDSFSESDLFSDCDSNKDEKAKMPAPRASQKNPNISPDTKIWQREIRLLRTLSTIDFKSERFIRWANGLSKLGESERMRVGSQVSRRKLPKTET